MTPSAVTPAAARQADRKRAAAGGSGRSRTAQGRPSNRPASDADGSRSAGHRGTVRRTVAPRSARRVSGPASGVSRPSRSTTTTPAYAAAAPTAAATRSAGRTASRSTARATARATARPGAPGRLRRLPSLPIPRRVSGPVRPSPAAPRRSAQRRAAAPPQPLAVRIHQFVRALPDHAWLDRIIRGRVWIPLLGILLVGIVALQVTVLKLNAGIGRSLQQTTSLQGQNEVLRADVARLSDSQRIEALASHLGMVMPPPQEDRFITPGASTVGRAVRAIQSPNASAFDATLAAEQASIAAQSAAATASSGTPSTAAPTTSTATAPAATTAVAPSTTTPSTSYGG